MLYIFKVSLTRTFLMKIFLFDAQLFKNVEVDENVRIDGNLRTRDITE